MTYKPDHYDRDRVAGAQLAKKLGATKTAATIEDPTKNFKDIFAVAVGELGVDKLVAALANASPVWAHAALHTIPDLGAHNATLLKKVAEAPDGTISPGSTSKRAAPTPFAANVVAAAAVMGGPLSKMTLHNHLAADCNWTMEWFDGAQQPTQHYPDWNKWKWNGTLTAGCSGTMSVADCAKQVPNSPLKSGDVIWIYVFVNGGFDKNGKDDLSSFQFTYDSGNPSGAEFGISGTTTINTLSMEKYPS
jgi:hypothetical protein